MSKLNIYVNSKNRKPDETPSNFSVIIPDGLLKVNKDEYFTLSVNSFFCYNDFYQCNSSCNSFNIIAKTMWGCYQVNKCFIYKLEILMYMIL